MEKFTRLTRKQQVFVDEYLCDLNATQAAIRAGYSSRTANEQGARLLANVSIKKRIADLMKARRERTEITQDYVLTVIQETVERCRQVAPVLDRQGNQVLVETQMGEIVPAFAFDPKSVLRGAELLGKHLGMFTNKLEIAEKDGGPIEFTDIERIKRINAIFDSARKRRDGQTAETISND